MSDLTLCTSGAIIALLAIAATLSGAASGVSASPAAIAQMIVVTVDAAAAERSDAPADDQARELAASGVSHAAAVEPRRESLHRQWWTLDLPPPSA